MDNYIEVLKTKRKIEKDFLKIEGIHGLSIGYEQLEDSFSDNLMIYFHIHDKDLLTLGVIPQKINGIKTAVIETDIPRPLADKKKYKSLIGGIQIQTEDRTSGTLGCIMTDKKSGEKVGLSCKHILTDKNAMIGHPAFMHSNCIGRTIRGTLSKNVDAAIFSIENIDCEPAIVQAGDIKGWHTVTLRDIKYGGFPVRKRGMATGLTFGLVKNIHFTGYRSDGWQFTDQLWIDGYEKIFSSEGDSGSVYLDVYNRIIGLHWGCEGYHTGVGSSIEDVMLELNLDLALCSEETKSASSPAEIYSLVI